MKVVTDKGVTTYLDKNLNKASILEKLQPALLKSLNTYRQNPDEYVPHRTVKASNNDASDTVHLFMPCTAPNEVGLKVISGGPGNNSKGLGFQGCTLIMDEITGAVKGVVNAKNLTAFRTALASSLALTKVIPPGTKILPQMSVIGVGPQAVWHIKMGLALYEEIEQVNIVNRSLENAEKLAEKLSGLHPSKKFNALSYGERIAATDIKNAVLNSSLIFGCSPSTSPVIMGDYVNSDPKFPVFISLIGSYKPHMIELEADFISKEFLKKGTKILVDSKSHTLAEAGELIQTSCTPSDLMEVAEALESGTPREVIVTESNISLQKIVGLSIMDISTAKLIVEDPESEAIDIEDF